MASHNCPTPVPVDLTPSSALCGHQTHRVHRHAGRQTLIHRIYLNLFRKLKNLDIPPHTPKESCFQWSLNTRPQTTRNTRRPQGRTENGFGNHTDFRARASPSQQLPLLDSGHRAYPGVRQFKAAPSSRASSLIRREVSTL